MSEQEKNTEQGVHKRRTRYKWWRLLWRELFSSVGKPHLSYQYGGMLVYLDYSDGNGIGIRVLYSQEETGL